ncbi:hypothetical protein BKA70DRAFT_774328 [Coprinopsis sp. MPI-PUGE-AT-0042]|nr:hypothetical protein BKA70DRAFT_774328 [Coprinopsis sp. MPI-PUGE-AT-0042]
MHRCLQIIDIIHAICEHLDDSRSTLVQLSQTCRVLERPTTEIIWRTLDKGIDPLLDAIGGGLWEWEVTETDTGEKNRRLKRAITLQDRAALRRLGRRVKRLSIHGEHMIPSSFECLAALYASTNPNEEAYFPLLDELCVWQTQTMGIRDLSSLRIFAGPWLRILRMSLHRVTPQDLAFLSGFQGHCLNIQVLQLHFPHLAHLVASSAGALFECWPRLHTLFVQTVPFEAIEALSYLPRLTNLTATLFTSSSSPSSFNAQGGGGFPALSNLALYTANGLEFCIPVVQLLHDCPIERLRIEAGNYSPHAESFERLIRLLPRRLKHSSLRELSILEPRFALRAEQRTARIQNDPTFLSVLVVFTRLRELTSPIPCYTLSLMTLTALASGLQTLE